MRPFLVVLAAALVAAASAVAKPEVRPVEPFFAATPRADSIVLRQRPGGDGARDGERTDGVRLVADGRRRGTRGNWVGVISTALPNGVLGWVPRKELSLRRVAWSIDDLPLLAHARADPQRRRRAARAGRRRRVGLPYAGRPTTSSPTTSTRPTTARRRTAAASSRSRVIRPHPPAGWNPNRDWRLAIHGGANRRGLGRLRARRRGDARYLMRMTPLGTPVTSSRSSDGRRRTSDARQMDV